MAKKHDDDDVPDAASSLRQLSRLASLWRANDHVSELNPVQWDALRFLAQANRFSNSPGALSKYLGATKGTISQTLTTLEKKGLIAKSARDSDQRSVGLSLTDQGKTLLSRDQRSPSLNVLQSQKPKVQRRFAQVLEALLSEEAKRQHAPSFGTCGSCRYFREAPHCMKFEVSLDAGEQEQLCVEHQAR